MLLRFQKTIIGKFFRSGNIRGIQELLIVYFDTVGEIKGEWDDLGETRAS